MAIAFHLDMKLEQLASWLNSMSQPVLIIQDDGLVEEVNRQFVQIIQYSRDDVVGRMYSQFLHLPSEMITSHSVDQVEQGCRTVEGELVSRSGNRYLCTIQILSGRDGDRRVHFLALYPHTRKQEDHFLSHVAESMFNALPLGLLMIDNQGNLMGINDRACQFFNVEKSEVIHHPMKVLFSKDNQEQQRLMEEIVHNKGGVQTLVCTHGAREAELSIFSGPLYDRNGQISGRYFAFRDITHLRLLEERLERNDRLAMIGQIAAGAAHEIRNPLTSIRGFLQVMENTLKEKVRSKEHGYTEIMLREIDRINSLVGEFLLLSKPRSDKLYPIQVTDVFSEILPIIKGEAILHNVEVEYQEGTVHFPWVIADGKMLKQIFLNICKNGIESMDEGGTLAIQVRNDLSKRRLIIEICDNGQGIPPTVIDQIFDPFFTTKETGTGLGLAICQRLIQDIGGNICVISDRFGTTFTVYLPTTIQRGGESI